MRSRSLLKPIAGYALAAIAFLALLVAVSALMRPDLSGDLHQYSEDEIAETNATREMAFDTGKPIVLHQQVDYGAGRSADWYPKGEPPILTDLVKEGELPPVAERVGGEPCVMKGIEGTGKYGGTWIRIANSDGDAGIIFSRLGYANLVRWSPLGHPIVPHLAKSYTISPDNREFVFTLRKGMKWSDGHPFTADDVVFWWQHLCSDLNISAVPPSIMMVRGKPGNVEKLGPRRVKFSFPEPNGIFLARMATYEGTPPCNAPAHYLSQYHPTIGDQAVIDAYMNARKLQSPIAAFRDVQSIFNPEHPRVLPWVYRTYKANPPQTFVRNPYYCVVDSQGNQLPYVDRILVEVKSPDQLGISVAQGDVTMQARHVRYDQYTLLMSQRKKYGFDVYHWYPGDRSYYAIQPNLNRRIEPDKPSTKFKHELLNDRRFRQALSLAIDRSAIIEAEYNNQTEAAQVAPGPASFFYEPSLYKSYVDHDPDRANELLDEIGLTQRDYEGYRTSKDGSRLTFYLNYCSFTGEGPGQFVQDDWAKVGIRLLLRERSRALFSTELWALKHDFSVWISNGEFFPLCQPRFFAPVSSAFYALGFARWYLRGGLYGDSRATREFGCIEPPRDHPLRRALEVYERASAESEPAKQRDIFREALQIAAENTWTINICTTPPMLMVVKDGFRNVPRTAVYSWDFQSPGNTGIETFYFDRPYDSPGAIAQMKQEILKPTPPVDAPTKVEKTQSTGQMLAKLIQRAFLALAALVVILVGVKHPYIGRRLIIMVPTLLIISIIVFVVIQLPPGDFVTTKIMQLQESGDDTDRQLIEDLKVMFSLDDPMIVRYVRWLGLNWFTTFDDKDQGLLQGNMGRSMESLRPVNSMVGDRVILTFLISLGTILFVWSIAIPIGIYSAVKQYSIGDYVLTFAGFIGMCIPDFLLAILLMYVSAEWFGIPISGLFSSQYGAQPEWTWGKVVDLLQHIWVPIMVLGVVGTAGMIRVMRANLLDELRKPYVVTARAKGVRPMKLLFKYPVRMALNPFISGIGALFPQLVSGGAIVAMILSLPTVGPLMLSALFSEDMYLAGSMLMVLSLLGVVGTLVSDLLLLWLDPRIRFER